MENMTAKVSCFARAYHFRNAQKPIFSDTMAEKLLGEKEYQMISENMAQGISFFAPGFNGSNEEALSFIVDSQLSPSVLARSAFCERHLKHDVGFGCRQYIVFAAGYDTFAFRENVPELTVFNLDLPEMIADRQARVEACDLECQTASHDIVCDLSKGGLYDALRERGFDPDQKTFGSLLGISYYLTKADFRNLLSSIEAVIPKGSALCMDYPCENESMETEKNRELAARANEQMKARYSYEEMESMLAECGFLIYEHLDAAEMTKQYFEEHNAADPAHKMKAPEGVAYLLAVKNVSNI